MSRRSVMFFLQKKNSLRTEDESLLKNKENIQVNKELNNQEVNIKKENKKIFAID